MLWRGLGDVGDEFSRLERYLLICKQSSSSHRIADRGSDGVQVTDPAPDSLIALLGRRRCLLSSFRRVAADELAGGPIERTETRNA